MAKLITTEISDERLDFNRGDGPAKFTLTVHNASYREKENNQFASFQLKLLAAGSTQNMSQDWYRLVPAVSSKIPPGDSTQFQVEILDVPPVADDFTGMINLTARIYSPELRDEDRKDIRLVVGGEALRPPKVSLSEDYFKAAPNDTVRMTASFHNPNRTAIECVVKINGVESTWFPEGSQKTIPLAPNAEKTVYFICAIPSPDQAISSVYPLSLDLLSPVVVTTAAKLSLDIIPAGEMDFSCTPLEQWLPEKSRRWLNPRSSTADFSLDFNNRSNLLLTGTVNVQPLHNNRRFRWPWRGFRSQKKSETRGNATGMPAGVSLDPPVVELPAGQSGTITLRVDRKLPWLGWSRIEELRVEETLTDDQPLTTDSDTKTQTLELHILTVIPWLLQLLAGLAGVALLAAIIWKLLYQGHTKTVNSVQFNGQGNQVVSASDDGTVRRWRVRGRRLSPVGVVERSDKSIRVARYRPVNNDEVVAGFENGTLGIYNLLSKQSGIFEFESDDRVFDVAFSRDARQLFSGHGSGRVLQWNTDPSQRKRRQTDPVREVTTGFAVNAIALLGENDHQLAIAGRYNNLVILNLTDQTSQPLPYWPGGQTDYILSLATAEANPQHLATADNQGNIALWDLQQCLNSQTPCEPVDQWLGHGGTAVRDVAFSQDGCYLASAGDDGAVKLWSLTTTGLRQPDALEGDILQKSASSMQAVSIIQQRDTLQVVGSGDDTRMRLSTLRIQPGSQSVGNCSVQ